MQYYESLRVLQVFPNALSFPFSPKRKRKSCPLPRGREAERKDKKTLTKLPLLVRKSGQKGRFHTNRELQAVLQEMHTGRGVPLLPIKPAYRSMVKSLQQTLTSQRQQSHK